MRFDRPATPRVACSLLVALALGACDGDPPAAPAPDAALDVAMDASVDASLDRPRDSTPPPLPRTFQDDYLPEFRIDVAPTDLDALLAMGSTTRVAMTLRYMGASYPGTIRQRLGNNSRCGDRRQFRLDFPEYITLPDGYRTDRFETDRGSCYVLHEWLSGSIARRVSRARPELYIPYKYANVVAIYFNDALYHVETLTEDTNRDVMERFAGTRNLTFYPNGCAGGPEVGWIHTFCTTFDPAALRAMLDIPTYLAWAAMVKALVPGDNYPDRPYNWSLVRNEDTGLAAPLGEDWDEVPGADANPMADPFAVTAPDMDFQRHFTELLAQPALRAQYVTGLRAARAAMAPELIEPLLAMKYAQVRPLLMQVTGVGFRMDQFDSIYMVDLPRFFRARYEFLGRTLGM